MVFLTAPSCSQAADALAFSPAPEPMAAREAWKFAEAMVSTRADCDVVIGAGGSMLPLYPDRTVLVIQRLPLGQLRAGMTVVFLGDTGRPVAHTLIERTARGWRAQGLANAEPDKTLVRFGNYLGTVVRAFTPMVGARASAEAVGEE